MLLEKVDVAIFAYARDRLMTAIWDACAGRSRASAGGQPVIDCTHGATSGAIRTERVAWAQPLGRQASA